MLTDWSSADVSEWVGELPAQFVTDSLAFVETMGTVLYPAWDCPLRRRAFYSNGVPGFGPSLPSARRSERVFGHMTGGSFAHPTQARADASAYFGSYKSSNGFCFCPILENPVDGECKQSTLPKYGSHPCSLLSTVQAIRGVAWQTSYSWIPKPKKISTPCSVQLDWPFVGGRLRDNTNLLAEQTSEQVWAGASDVEGKRCHVLDRMPEFRYTYRSLGPLARSSFNTIRDGVCHTGRVQKFLPTSDRCVRFTQNTPNTLSNVLLCNQKIMTSSTGLVNRAKSRGPGETTLNRQRQRCSRCSPPPSFKTRGGAHMQPESSFGIPYRLSAERVIAADLKEALCGNESECLQGLNKTAWRAGEFAHTFLSEPARLFSNFSGMIANLTESSALLPTPPPDDAALWKTPWMFCPTPSSMKSGVNCTGAITKEQWRTSKRQLCPQAIQEGTRGQTSPIAAIPVCGMAASLSSLCTDLTQARSLISSANCLKDSIDNNNALCAIKEYVYTPATWETSNMAFVHETVRNYYKRMDNCPARDAAGGGCICPVDYNISLIEGQNQKLLQTCSAQDALVVATLLTQARGLVTPLIHIIATGLDMLLNFVLMLQGGNTDAQ